jgi:hypothetical protein
MHHRPPGSPAVLRAALVSALRRLHGGSRLLFRGFVLLAIGALVGTVAAVLAPGSSAAHRAAPLAVDASYRLHATTAESAAHSAARSAVPARARTADQATQTKVGRNTATPSAISGGRHEPGSQVAQNRGRRRGDHRREQPDAVVANPNCTLVVPDRPTSVTGLTTPYRLVATDRRAGACHETNSDQSAFVEAAIIDPTAGAVSIYHPVVVDRGATPAAAPVPVQLPPGAVVGVWFGFNGDTLTLGGPGARSCVNGLPGSPFGQFAYCHAAAFFGAANAAVSGGKLTLPPLGTASDGLPCPTTRDFFVVDQDQSDNLATTYRIVNGEVAQNTADTRAGTALTNGSDEGLLAKSIDPALGCAPFRAPDLTDGGALTPALALNELSAAAFQKAPIALTPTSDPMTMVDGAASVEKTNLYRAGVDQPSLAPGQDPETYCANMLTIANARLARDSTVLHEAATPVAGAASLFGFLTTRLESSATNLQCSQPDRTSGRRSRFGARGDSSSRQPGSCRWGVLPSGCGTEGE